MGGHTSPVEVARKQIRMYDAGLKWLAELVRAHGIDCKWNPVGKFHAAASEAGVQNLRASLAQYREWGVDYEECDRDALQHKLGTRYYQYGFHSSNNVFVQPAALIRGLADSLPPNVVVVENEAVLSLSESRPFQVTTSRGAYTADRVILANNGFAKALGILNDRLITIFTYAALTPRLPESELAKWETRRNGASYQRIVSARRCGVCKAGASWFEAPTRMNRNSRRPTRWRN